MTAPLPIVEKLRAPSYWMSGSSDGHEGENDKPREAADIIEELYEALFLMAHDSKQISDDPVRLQALATLRKVRGEQ